MENIEKNNRPGTDWIRGKRRRESLASLAVTTHCIYTVFHKKSCDRVFDDKLH